MRHKNGTLIEWHSGGNQYYGFVVGTCSYDNCGDDNAYVARYVMKDNDPPRRPYTLVRMDRVELVKDWPEDFFVAGHWSASPDDRCSQWKLAKDEETGNFMIVPEA